MYFLIEYVIFF